METGTLLESVLSETRRQGLNQGPVQTGLGHQFEHSLLLVPEHKFGDRARARALATIVVTFVGTLVAVPPPDVDNNDCQHQDLFDSTLREGENPVHM